MNNPQEREPQMQKDGRVLSVPAGKTYALMTEHNVYSCPVDYIEHDETVDALAPRNEVGKIPRVYRIAARIVTDPNGPNFPGDLKPEYNQNIRAYISIAKSIKGILDGGGQYRFYILTDVEYSEVKHSPRLSVPGAAHVYLSLKNLRGGSDRADPIN